MRAAFIENYGRDQKLRVGDFADPVLSEEDLLIEIHAASLNPIDFKVRDGLLRFIRPFQFPLILGHDFAGVVLKVGARTSGFSVGDRVYGRPRGSRIGTLAEKIAVDFREVAKMPSNLSFVEAASLPLLGLTSWQALVDVADVRG